MKDRIAFRNKVEEFIKTLDEHTFTYNKDEYWMILSPYEFLEYYSFENRLWNTCIALPLARGLHDGTYRRATVTKHGSTSRLPYVIHCLLVCRMLADMNLPISREDEDILLASALCHDMIEDMDFPKGGLELIEDYKLDKRIYDIVKLVSKRKGASEAELTEHFQEIQQDKLALLVKLSDRSHNVEDLYNMSFDKFHDYVEETNKFVLPMCEYGFEHYPELGNALAILKDKIICLTQAAVVMFDRYEEREQELRRELKELRAENKRLFEDLNEIWER